MRFKQLDLNLLNALDVLLEERNVSHAAERLSVSQPTMSAALGRLRSYFNDPILVQQGRVMTPTTRALELRPMVREVLAQVNDIIAASHGFQASTSQRRFYISASDFITVTILSRLVARLHQEAPGVCLEILPPQDNFLRPQENGEVDLLILPAEYTDPAHPSLLLSEERHVIAGCRENPLLHRGITEDDFYRSPQIAVSLGHRRRFSFSETQLRARGRSRNVELTVSSFLIGPELLPGTDRLLMMPKSLARIMASRLPIAVVEPPFAFPVFKEMMHYHASRESDPGLKWLIQKTLEAARDRETQ